MRPAADLPLKHLGLDGECPADIAENPVTARPSIPYSGGVAQTVTAKSGGSPHEHVRSPRQGKGASVSQ